MVVEDRELGPDAVGLVRPAPRRPVGARVRDWVGWFGPGRLVTVAAAVVAVGAGGFWLLRTPSAPVEASLPMTSTSAPSTSVAAPSRAMTSTTERGDPGGASTTRPADVLVHVAGAVSRPGVHRLAAGARVVDAIAAAGGPAPDADVDAVNQAQVLRDGDRLYVPRVDEDAPVAVGVTPASAEGAGSSASSPAASPSTPIDVNIADAGQLDLLPGIGPATAAAIVAHRTQFGPFASVDDLADVRGIGPSKLDAIRGLVVV
jgi:competence protein ComEA